MSESRVHADQIEALELFVRQLSEDRPDLVFYRDIGTVNKQQIPPLIRGFRPDLFARLWKTDDFYIGESKSGLDLRTTRTRLQLRAFAEEVAADSRGQLILCAPFSMQAVARGLLWEVCGEELIQTRNVYCIYPEQRDASEGRLGRRS